MSLAPRRAYIETPLSNSLRQRGGWVNAANTIVPTHLHSPDGAVFDAATTKFL